MLRLGILAWLWLTTSMAAIAAGTVNSNLSSIPGVAATDWPWWRGPNRDGIVQPKQRIPIRWSENENILWKLAVPGRSHGSITVVGENLFLAVADHSTESQSVLCIDRHKGQLRWSSLIHQGGFTTKGNEKSSQASSSVACDGERLFVNFLNHEAIHATALDLKGNKLWQRKIADFATHQGFGASPALYGSSVIFSADSRGGGAIVSLDRATGKEVWRHPRPALANYTSPIILNAAGRDQVVLTGCDLVTSLDPLTGKVLWEIPGSTTECVTSAVTDGTRVFTSGGYPKNHLAAVMADGSGKIAWENASRVYVPSLIARNGFLFGVMDAGVAVCWKSDTGHEQWKGRLRGTFSASPVLVGDSILATNESGESFIFKADPTEFKLIAENKLGDEVYATPTICYDRIFMRVAKNDGQARQEFVYCIGERESRRKD